MTQPLAPSSPRKAAARAFGVELRKTMVRRQVGQHRVAAAAKVASSSVTNWKAGSNLPTLAVALRVSEALDNPKLAEIVRDARRHPCDTCGRVFLNEGGKPKRFCSDACRETAGYRRQAPRATAARTEALRLLGAELLRVGPIRKQAIGKALTLLEDEEEHSPGLVARRRLPVFEDAISAFCAGCEPLGYCRTPSCELRPVSPLPLLVSDREAEVASKAPGAWGSPENAERVRAATRRGNAERWSRPRERERARALMQARWDAMSDEERVAFGQRISERRRAASA